MVKVISFGYRCSSASLIKLLNLKTESYPFDWLVSSLDVIRDCIETQFVHFLDRTKYRIQSTETFNQIDDVTYEICKEVAHINTHYETDQTNTATYRFPLALNHYTVANDYEYYQRCIARLYAFLDSTAQKYYLHFHPIMGMRDYQMNKDTILSSFTAFHQYIATKTRNIFGVYFILIKYEEENGIKHSVIHDTADYVVIVLLCNAAFLDGGDPFMGHSDKEREEVLALLKGRIRV